MYYIPATIKKIKTYIHTYMKYESLGNDGTEAYVWSGYVYDILVSSIEPSQKLN